jgi:hypothetical protein
MKSTLLMGIIAIGLCSGWISCGGTKALDKAAEKTAPKVTIPQPIHSYKYKLHLNASGSRTTSHDDINIDTNGQMIFDTQQLMKDGTWQSPHGMAFLDPRDADTLLSFIKIDALFSIDESDVSTSCPNGDRYLLQITRTDPPKKLSITTNTCSSEYNLLVGEQRKIYPAFLAYMGRLRRKYRPLFSD